MVKLEARMGIGDDGVEPLSEKYFSPYSYIRTTHSMSTIQL